MYVAGLVITGAAGVGILIIGIMYLATPRSMAENFGLPAIPQSNATAWLRLKGLRDLATGVVAVTLLIMAPPVVLAWAVVGFTIIPLGDAGLILHAGGPKWAALGIHGATAALMLLGAAFLFAV